MKPTSHAGPVRYFDTELTASLLQVFIDWKEASLFGSNAGHRSVGYQVSLRQVV
jgi:hypothetical protein